MEKENYRFDIKEMGGGMAKNDRIRKLIPIFEAGRMYLPETCVKRDYEHNQVNLTQSFLKDEYELFPVSPHDDMLDCMARIVDPEFNAKFPAARPVRMPSMADGNYNPLAHDSNVNHRGRQTLAIG